MSTHEANTDVRPLGLARWIGTVFGVVALILFWVLAKAITLVWERFAEPHDLAISVASFGLAGVLTMLIYSQPKVKELAYDIVGELAKVSWPTRKETSASTVVVIIASMIAAAIVGTFDAIWSAITDLIYKV
jgi:preprotein translocase subunit SecE